MLYVSTLAHAGTPGNIDANRLLNANQDAANWLAHGRTYDEQRFSPLTRINDQNVAGLGLAWTQKLDIDRGTEATPSWSTA
ncbi:hypothetical protein NWF32_28060 [Pseudomonas qingdaonensis]|nr:hypothetical protein [Pseudomonas qingdaonensis]